MAGKKSYAGIEIEFTANYSDLVKSLRKIDDEAEKLKQNLNAAQKAMIADPENVELQAAAQKTLADAIDNVTRKLKLLESTEQEINEQYKAGEIPVNQYVKFQAELSKTKAGLETYKKAIGEYGQEVVRLRDKLNEAETALKKYNEAAEKGGKVDGLSGQALENKISDTVKRIEIYKQKIAELLAMQEALEQEQLELASSTDELTAAQDKAASSAAAMGEGYSTTKAIIADLASSVIKKTANALVDFAKGSVEAASSLYEVENVVDVAFENMRDKADEFAKTSIETYGISELTAKRTAALYTSMAKAMDITLDKSSDMAIALAQRSADMASFYDISQDITSTALKSVFTGETESLKRFGVVMTEVNLQQYAYSQGIEKSIKDMTQAEKVQLRFNYLMQQTSAAGGDFARTSDSFANKTRQLKERLTETSIVIGNQFIKNLDGAFNTLDDFLAKVEEAGENGELDDTIKDISDILKGLITVLSTLSKILLKFPKLTATAAVSFTAFNKINKIAEKTDILNKSLTQLIPKMSGAGEAAAETGEAFKLSAGAAVAAGTAIIALEIALADYFDTLAENARNANKLSEELQKEVDAANELAETYAKNAESRRENIASIEAEYDAIRDNADKLLELADKSKKTNTEIAEMKSLADQLNASMQGLGLEVDSTTGYLNMQKQELLDLIDGYEQYQKAAAAQAALTDAYKEQYSTQAKYNAANKKRIELATELDRLTEEQAKADEKLNEIMSEETDNLALRQAEYAKAAKGYDERAEKIKKLSDEVDAAQQEENGYAEALGFVNSSLEELNEINKQTKDDYDEIKKRIDSATTSEEKQAKKLDELSEAYKKAESAVSSYKTAISELNDLQKNMAEGTELSTAQMVNMIDKYPELVNSIEETKKGYVFQKDALEELTEARLNNLRLAAKEKQAAAEEIFFANKGSKGQLESIKKLFDEGQIKDISTLQGEGYAEGLYDAIKAYSEQKGLDRLVSDVLTNGFKEGAKAESETEKATKKTAKSTTKATKEEAEALVKIFKHRYNQGIIDAETYYKKLDEIAKEYYGNEAGYLERYMELEDEAQAGIKKAIEDKAKSYQTLEDKIEGVTEARKKLLGIESNKNVQDYDEATGFKLEIDKSAYAQASRNLYDAQRQLVTSLAEMSNGGTGIYEALGNKLADSTAAALESILPEMIDYESVPTTQNYTFNFGDIKASGDAAAFRKMLNDFVNQVVNETQII
ncbi:MAG: hypothetical protein K6F91_03695 [Ruminococcus sp.]|nr:hypothetical protein [Ruminococcus sp.]